MSDVCHGSAVAHIGGLRQVVEGRAEVLLIAMYEQVGHCFGGLRMSVVCEPLVVKHLLFNRRHRLDPVRGPPVQEADSAVHWQTPFRRRRVDYAGRYGLVIEHGRVAAFLYAYPVQVPETQRHLRHGVP